MKLKRPTLKLPFDFSDILIFLGVGLVTWALFDVTGLWLAAMFLGVVLIMVGIAEAI